MADNNLLLLRPQVPFGIVTAELKRVASYSQYMLIEASVLSHQLAAADDGQTDADNCQTTADGNSHHNSDSLTGRYQLAKLCEELQLGRLYSKYANKKLFRHEKNFWETTDNNIKAYVKRMADLRLLKAVRLADELDIPILFLPTKRTALNISNRLRLTSETAVLPVMNFDRHDEGTTYRLQLRVGSQLVDTPSKHGLIVLAYEPGMFVLDNCIYAMGEGFSGKLLLPFVNKPAVEIPRKMENDYFRRFILKHVTHAEVNATGFDIHDTRVDPQPRLKLEALVDGRYVLALHFCYGTKSYTPNSKSGGQVTLVEEDGGFRFTRWLRNKTLEAQQTERLRQTTGAEPNARGDIVFQSLKEVIDWLRRYSPELRTQGFDVLQPSDHVYYIGPLDVEQSDTWHGDWLQTDVTIVLDGGRLRIPFSQLRDTILRGDQDYMLPTGERLLIPQEWLQRYGNLLLIGLPKGKGFQRHRSQMTGTEPDTPIDSADSADAIASVKSTDSIPPIKPKALRATLRPYQQTGVEWLWGNFLAQTGCCLSDEMGLGKTIQTIALLLNYKETMKAAPGPTHVRKPEPGMLFSAEEMQGRVEAEQGTNHHPRLPYRTSLVVAPASVVHNWRNELNRFAPSLLVCTYTGDISSRRGKLRTLMRWDVVLTTYRTLHNDIDHLANLKFGIVVFDESQTFKNSTSLIHQAVSSLKACHRLALSGTPVENNLGELWSLMSVLNPCLLGDARHFQQSFVNPIARQMEESRRDLLRRLIAPYFLKRTKEEVNSDLPDRQDEVVVCPMTDEQTTLYVEELSRARNEWLDSDDSKYRQINVITAIQRLRQIANGEGKMAVVFEHLENLRTTRHKVLIFSEYVALLTKLGDEMERRGWQYDLLTGQTRNREQVIAHFQSEADCQFFLISLKAGGVGLNLTAADYVFLLDPWWNLAAEEQAIARAHRIGQRQPVFVYRFVSADTLEEQILTLQERKQSLIDSVMPFICKK